MQMLLFSQENNSERDANVGDGEKELTAHVIFKNSASQRVIL